MKASVAYIILGVGMLFLNVYLNAQWDSQDPPSFWDESVAVGFGWYEHPFGHYWIGEMPDERDAHGWLFHGRLGWLYLANAVSDVFWFYSSQLEYFARFPEFGLIEQIYSTNRGWGYDASWSFDPVWIYWYETEGWESYDLQSELNHPFLWDEPAELLQEGNVDTSGFPSGRYTAKLAMRVTTEGKIDAVDFLFGSVPENVDIDAWKNAVVDAGFEYMFEPATRRDVAITNIVNPPLIIIEK